MPRFDIDRDAFLDRVEHRRWAFRRYWMRRVLGVAPRRGRQAAVYDATFRSDAEAVAYFYAQTNKHMPDFEDPSWINEKVRWQFLNHPNPLMSLAADKISVRAYLALKGAEVHPPEMIAMGSDPASSRRSRCRAASCSSRPTAVARTTSRRGVAPRAARSRRRSQAGAAGTSGGEMHYRMVPKRWLVEEFIEARREKLEFKFFCIRGEPLFVTVITERSGNAYKRAAYDLDWRRLDLRARGAATDRRPVPRPPSWS